MRIKLQLPPPPLYPNYRSMVPWPKVKATGKYRAEAALLARVQLGPSSRPQWTHAWARVTFYHPSTRQYRDPDNMVAALKAVWDGFTDAGLLKDDRRLTMLPIGQDVDAGLPRVEIEINEGAPPRMGDSDE